MARQQDNQPETLGDLEEHQIGVLITHLACNRYDSVPSERLTASLGHDYATSGSRIS